MTTCGVLVINKVHGSTAGRTRRTTDADDPDRPSAATDSQQRPGTSPQRAARKRRGTPGQAQAPPEATLVHPRHLGARHRPRRLHPPPGRGGRSRARVRPRRGGHPRRHRPARTPPGQAPATQQRSLPLQRRLRGPLPRRRLPGVGHPARRARRTPSTAAPTPSGSSPKEKPDFDRLYGLRNDSEAFNSQLKRTLLVDRAMSLGAHRQLLDVLCFALLNNTTNAYRAARQQVAHQASQPPSVRRRTGLGTEPEATALPTAA